MLHIFLWVRIPSIVIASVTSKLNSISPASEYVLAKSICTIVGDPSISPTPWPKAYLDLLFISMPPSCMEHALLTGLSPTQVHRSSFLFFFLVSCTSSPLPWHWKVCCFEFPLLYYFPFCNMIFGIDTVVNEWLSHGMPFPAPVGEGKLESRLTVTRLSLDCLILVRSLI